MSLFPTFNIQEGTAENEPGKNYLQELLYQLAQFKEKSLFPNNLNLYSGTLSGVSKTSFWPFLPSEEETILPFMDLFSSGTQVTTDDR